MPADLKPLLARLARGETLADFEAEAAFSIIMEGGATEAQIASLLTAMKLRGETLAELLGAVRAMRARMVPVAAPEGAMDVCGTGGDGLGTLNVSTATALAVAACGVVVAKHGNRALSSRAGGADVLAALGVPMEQPVAAVEAQIRRLGIGFLFAPLHHPALRHAAVVRRDLGFRTIFNLLGPMCNPAGVTRQLSGVYDPAWAPVMARTLGELGSERVWIVHGAGLDELTLAGETLVCEWNRGVAREFLVSPEDAGLRRAPVSAILGGDAAENAAALRAMCGGQPGAYRDTVLLNAAAALVVAERVADVREGVGVVADAVDRGAVLALLEILCSSR